jgi:hypothetical protein
LNDVSSFTVGGAFFELHCSIAYDATNEIDQRAFVVVARRAHFLFTLYTQCDLSIRFGHGTRLTSAGLNRIGPAMVPMETV